MSKESVTKKSLPWRDIAITAAAFVLAFVIGGILMVISDPEIVNKWAYFFDRPGDAVGASWTKISSAYSALAEGSLGGLGPLTETTAQAAPLIIAGLGVGLAFRAGLFNIGAQGQATMGAIVAAYIGFTWHLPYFLHMLVAVLAGVLAGALWGAFAGWLKAHAGAHEVIVTIMLNYIAAILMSFALTTAAFHRPGRNDPISPIVDWSAVMPRIEGTRLHLGFLLALLAALLVWWVLERSTIGFAIRAVGANPNAAKTAGMSVASTTTLTMLLAGGLAGLAGTLAVLAPTIGGMPVPLSAGIVGTIGFDAITVALLGRSKPVGTILAGLLFGAMQAGGLAMQSKAQTPLELTTVLQALIVMFVAAPRLVETLLPFLRERKRTEASTASAATKGAAA
ncbi:MAG: ABC transporter permease [Propionibacteriaceae bacterium]